MPTKPKKTKPAAVQPTHISVTFKIVTPDQLRRIIFTLSRLVDAKQDSWSVMFELDERADATKDFNLVIQLQVNVDHEDSDKAAATAKNGMDSDQHSQALIAGDVAKASTKGEALKEDAEGEAAGIVSARSSS